MLKLINLTKKFGSYTAVNNLNLEVKAGELFGFLGPNGAGKTTTIKMIAGLYTPNSGKILIDNLDSSSDRIKINQRIAYIPDQPFVYDKLTGKEFLQFCGGLHKLSKHQIKNKIDELCSLLMIDDWINKRTEYYSQGMKQRIVIAAALINDPLLFIVDEPMVGLDPQSAHIVKQLFLNKVKDGAAIFMSTHSLNVAEEVCNKVGIITKGNLIFNNTIENLRKMKEEKQNNLEQLFLELTAEE